MGCVGDETAQPPLRSCSLRKRGLDLRQHRVQGQSEPPDLGLRRRRFDAPAVIADRDLACNLTHPPQRTQPDLDDQEGKDQGAGDHGGADHRFLRQQLAEGRLHLCQRNRKHDELAVEPTLRPVGHPELDSLRTLDRVRRRGFVGSVVGQRPGQVRSRRRAVRSERSHDLAVGD